ncbi:MAG: hypothetical protein ACI4U2_04965 [Christensenellaceae bacterium]
MNCLDQLCGNNCLWILIFLLVVGCFGRRCDDRFSGCALPLAIALGLCVFRRRHDDDDDDDDDDCSCGCGCN